MTVREFDEKSPMSERDDQPTQLDRIEAGILETLAIALASDYGHSWYRLDKAQRAQWRTEAIEIMAQVE